MSDFIVPMVSRIKPMESIFENIEAAPAAEATDVHQPTFLDVFTDIYNNAVDTQGQKSQDVVDLMNGTTDNIEQLQIDLTKAEVATELLVNVKNVTVEAYNEIVKMSI